MRWLGVTAHSIPGPAMDDGTRVGLGDSLRECPELDLAGGLVDGRKNITVDDHVIPQG